jgi:hypothetical protein
MGCIDLCKEYDFRRSAGYKPVTEFSGNLLKYQFENSPGLSVTP